MATISRGPSSPTNAVSKRSSSRSSASAARPSISSSRPLLSPLEIRCTVSGGNSPLAASERPIGAPSRTRSAAVSMASLIGRLPTVAPAMRSPSSAGTALPVRMLKVRVKRAAPRLRSRRPSNGKRSNRPSKRLRAAFARNQRMKAKPPSVASKSSSSPHSRRNALTASSARVSQGKLLPPDSNTATTCGTTYVSRPATTTTHIAVSTMG